MNGSRFIYTVALLGLAVSYASASQCNWPTMSLTLDSTGSGDHSMLQLADGRPAIAYHHKPGLIPGSDLHFVAAKDVNGAEWPATHMKIDSMGTTGDDPSMVLLADGRPAIAYQYNNIDGELRFIAATDASGTGWSAPLKIAEAVGVGYFSASMVLLADGRPAIAYQHDDKMLRFIAATNVHGTAWPTSPLALAMATASAVNPSMVLLRDGRPAIAYSYIGSYDLHFIAAIDVAGTNWPEVPLAIDADGSTGGYPSMLLLADGRPAVAYSKHTGKQLRFIAATDVSGAVWAETPLALDANATGYNFVRPSMALLADGRPAIAYRFAASNDLLFIAATDWNSTEWMATPLPIDAAATDEPSMVVLADGKPAIAYGSNSDARFIHCGFVPTTAIIESTSVGSISITDAATTDEAGPATMGASQAMSGTSHAVSTLSAKTMMVNGEMRLLVEQLLLVVVVVHTIMYNL